MFFYSNIAPCLPSQNQVDAWGMFVLAAKKNPNTSQKNSFNESL